MIESTNLLEMYAERACPAKWAAMQIVKGGRNIKTAGEAFDMIVSVVEKAIEMELEKRAKNPQQRKESDGTLPQNPETQTPHARTDRP